jgi:N6-adenosine-specific RNA methylase IME4
MDEKYPLIYADPPWDYKGQTQHGGKKSSDTGGAINHYPCLKLPQLKAMKPMIDELAADDCLLFMWSSSPHLDQAIELMKELKKCFQRNGKLNCLPVKLWKDGTHGVMKYEAIQKYT